MGTFYKIRRFDSQIDLSNIYRICSDYYEQYKLFSVMNLNSYDSFAQQFERKLSSNFKDFLIIEVDKKFAGFMVSYDYKSIDGHIKLMLYYEKEFRSGFLSLAGIEFVDILFQYYSIRKIYTEVYSYNLESIRYHEKAGFIEECRLKEYRYFNGKYWDVIYYSIDRNHFYLQNQHLIDRFFKNKEKPNL